MKGNERQEHIMEAAIKRLAHFGINKTTLTEIAEDVNISKQALMYYYPDKQNLVAAVIEKISAEYFDALQNEITPTAQVEELFLTVIDIRYRLFGKYHMLFLQIENDGHFKSQELQEAMQLLHQKEEQLLATHLQAAIHQNIIRPCDAVQVCRLILETIHAISSFNKKLNAIPSPADIQLLNDKLKAVVRLMIKGIY